ncbi:E1 ubiquitin-activating enzyme [Malassezia yamatoensis]|uniref:Ubiquitin-activating enzyme E1-like n=1 Tax=Malassezia yamatoensis TaxID=253288 RepID=A0AAJ5YT30_9BASI|nr:E1 ubiquitin-activating enzyme [Malassezia yamatoensis]
MATGRYAVERATLGEEAVERLKQTRMLVVGAGGIGCEVLKDLVLLGVGHLEIIDLDTIDLSNLNRQFLFQKQHIQKPKAEVAKASASAFNSSVNITAHYASIQATEFDLKFFGSFDVVLSALDNLATRRYVNRMCIAANVPLVESGTAGFLGQVQPIRAGHTECYDCTEHPTPTTFPVCTIRSTPSTPMHCIVWAKNWLFPQLFGEDDESADAELEEAAKAGENSAELENLRKETGYIRVLRSELSTDPDQAARKVFEKVYNVDIRRLLSMEEMWETRQKPVPLSLDEAHADSRSLVQTEVLKDRQMWSLAETADAFLDSAKKLASRAAESNMPLAFDKDDIDALTFVTSASNLRAHVYHIPRQTQFDTKQLAGNIIPAIATTNAIVSGMAVVQALHMGMKKWDATRVVSVARRTDRYFTTFPPAPPNTKCGVCSDLYLSMDADVNSTTLQDVLDFAQKSTEDGGLGYDADAEISIADSTRILYDPDLEENLAKPLNQLRITQGSTLSVVDEDAKKVTVQLFIQAGHVKTPVVHWPNDQCVALKSRHVETQPETDSDSDQDAIQVVNNVTDGHSDATELGRKRRASDAMGARDSPAKRQASNNATQKKGLSKEAAIHLD